MYHIYCYCITYNLILKCSVLLRPPFSTLFYVSEENHKCSSSLCDVDTRVHQIARMN